MPSLENPQIFIIDDDRDDRDFIIQALQKEGFSHKFAEFENGEQLSLYLSANPDSHPDLVLLDLNMPVKNGFDTLKELKADNSLKSVPVVIFTASSKSDDRRICFDLGCDHFISKPLSVDEYKNVAHFLRSSYFGF